MATTARATTMVARATATGATMAMTVITMMPNSNKDNKDEAKTTTAMTAKGGGYH
jgi:hypothetical protein